MKIILVNHKSGKRINVSKIFDCENVSEKFGKMIVNLLNKRIPTTSDFYYKLAYDE